MTSTCLINCCRCDCWKYRRNTLKKETQQRIRGRPQPNWNVYIPLLLSFCSTHCESLPAFLPRVWFFCARLRTWQPHGSRHRSHTRSSCPRRAKDVLRCLRDPHAAFRSKARPRRPSGAGGGGGTAGGPPGGGGRRDRMDAIKACLQLLCLEGL